MSPTMEMMPAVNISPRTSTSLVTRVTRLPVGVRSIKEEDSPPMWEKSSIRRSNITFCPRYCRR